jgi:ribosomal protein S24E
LQVLRRSESKVLGRSYVEVSLDGTAGKISRNEAIESVSKELGVPKENVGLIRIDGESGTTRVIAKLYLYGSTETKKRLHQRHLAERTLSREEREKLKQERKKPAAQAAAPEAKK